MREKIKRYLESQIGRTIASDEPLVSSRLLDSLATARLMEFLAKDCGVDISSPDFDVDMLDTLDDIMLMVDDL